MKNFTSLALALAALGCSSYMKVEVEGRVVDETGLPVPRAEVTTSPWFAAEQETRMKSFVKTDDQGRFSATLPRSTGPAQALFANAPGEDRGGYVVLSGEESTNLTIVLRPLITVRGKIDSSRIPTASGRPVPNWVSAVTAGETQAVVASRWQCSSASVTFRLPPGSYEAHAQGPSRPLRRTFEVTASGGEVDLGTLELEPWPHQMLMGRPAPELHIADARGVPKDFKLSDWRGRRVVLFFWNHRMESNTHLLDILAAYHKHEAKADRYEILVVHNSDDVLTVRDLEKALWRKEIEMTLPVVIDDNEKSFIAFGLERGPMYRGSPSTFLIEPDGKVSSSGFEVYSLLLGKPRKP